MKQLVPKAVDLETVRLESSYICVSSELLEFTKNALSSEDSDEKWQDHYSTICTVPISGMWCGQPSNQKVMYMRNV